MSTVVNVTDSRSLMSPSVASAGLRLFLGAYPNQSAHVRRGVWGEWSSLKLNLRLFLCMLKG